MDIPNKADLLSMLPSELETFIAEQGEAKFRAAQIYGWMQKGVSWDKMMNLPKRTKEKLSEIAEIRLPSIREKHVSKLDGTVKYLFETCDGQFIESVVMRYHHGNSICVSSQAGCRMGCKFCASTLNGLARNLLPSEILGQIIIASADIGERISNVVMMGIGEPLDNYANVIRFLQLVNLPDGLNIGYRHISLSTCGIVPKIYELAEQDMQITLSISLHAANDTARSAIMPVNNRYPLAELMTACRDYFDITGRRISFEYTLISGKNDSEKDAAELAGLLKHYMEARPFHVNLIPVNEVSERDFARSTDDDIKKFVSALEKRRINATVRRRLGSDINASCGQLRYHAQKDH